MNKEEVKSIYSKYSSVYDKVFGHFFSPRIRMAIDRSLIAEGDKVVEVGVGTGISLTSYPHQCKIVGIDLTRKMLDQARRKKDRHKLDHVELFEMDAENMTFDDDTFDHAVAAFVITVVPNPEKMVSEMKRVTKKGGSIVILNHFLSDNAFISGISKVFSPLCEKWGWRSDIRLDLLSKLVDKNPEIFDLMPVAKAPNGLKQFPVRNDFAGMSNEMLQQIELLGRQVQALVFPDHASRREVNLEAVEILIS